MGSNVLIIENGKPYMAKPEGWNKTGIINTLKRAFTLKYEVYNDKDVMIGAVEFDSFKNYILIKKDTGNIAIQIPMFYLNAQKYYLNEKLTGFQVWPLWEKGEEETDIDIVIEAKKSLMEYSIEINCHDDNFEYVLKEFALGFLIRWMSYLY